MQKRDFKKGAEEKLGSYNYIYYFDCDCSDGFTMIYLSYIIYLSNIYTQTYTNVQFK